MLIFRKKFVFLEGSFNSQSLSLLFFPLNDVFQRDTRYQNHVQNEFPDPPVRTVIWSPTPTPIPLPWPITTCCECCVAASRAHIHFPSGMSSICATN